MRLIAVFTSFVIFISQIATANDDLGNLVDFHTFIITSENGTETAYVFTTDTGRIYIHYCTDEDPSSCSNYGSGAGYDLKRLKKKLFLTGTHSVMGAYLGFMISKLATSKMTTGRILIHATTALVGGGVGANLGLRTANSLEQAELSKDIYDLMKQYENKTDDLRQKQRDDEHEKIIVKDVKSFLIQFEQMLTELSA